VLGLGIVAAAVLSHADARGGEPGFVLVCRGGGSLHFTYTPYSNVSNEPQIWIGFERGSVPAGSNRENVNALGPGQCTWLDRTIAPNEPDRIVLTAPVFLGRQFSIQWQRGQVAGISSELRYLSVLQRQELTQAFRVYNDGRGSFIASGVE
jgi:hypothetical protein